MKNAKLTKGKNISRNKKRSKNNQNNIKMINIKMRNEKCNFRFVIIEKIK